MNPDAAAYLRGAPLGGGKTPLDAVYPLEAVALRRMAPTLTVARPDGLEALNPAAQAFAMSSGLPLRYVYPDPPRLVLRCHARGRQEINPAAVAYAYAISRQLADLYRSGTVVRKAPWHHRVRPVLGTVLGVVGGAAVGGPVGAFVGGAIGGGADAWRHFRRAA